MYCLCAYVHVYTHTMYKHTCEPLPLQRTPRVAFFEVPNSVRLLLLLLLVLLFLLLITSSISVVIAMCNYCFLYYCHIYVTAFRTVITILITISTIVTMT